MMPPHRQSAAASSSATTTTSSSPSGITSSTSIKSQRNSEILPVQQPGHHRDKLERIRNSLKPFEQAIPYESQMYYSQHPNLLNGHNGISIPSTSFPSSSSTNNYSAISEKSEDTQMFMINSLTQLGFDKESAYYALKLVNFSSVTDAANVLNRIKHDIALTQQIGSNNIINNNNNNQIIQNGIPISSDSSNNAITRTTTFYSSPARQPTTSNPAAAAQQQQQQQQQRLPRYTNLNGGTSSTSTTSTSTSKHTYLNISKSQTPDESRGSSRSESPNNNLRISPTTVWNRNLPPALPMEGEFHRSHAKISLKHTTSIDPNTYMRTGGAGQTTIISRSPIGAMISAPPSSTVITIERDTTPQQKPPIRRIEGGVPVIRTRVERPHLPAQQIISVVDSSGSKQHQQQQQFQQQQQQHLHRQIEKATHSIQSIIVDPDSAAGSGTTTHHSTVNYVDQLKATRLTKERDSVLSLSDHASGGNVSPNRSSGFTSPAAGMLISTTSDREPTPQPEGRIRSSSPLPPSISRRVKAQTYEKHVKPCKPGMYQFFMAQHIDSIIRQYEERNHRALQLLNEMAAAQFPEATQEQFLKVLRQKESKYIRLKRQKMDKKMFDIIKYVGVGAFGKVALVRKKDTQQTYAMKILSKEDVIQKKQSSHVKAERDILAEANSPWIVKLFFSFQDSRNLYFIMEYVPGGDMMQLLIVKGIFEEKLARFYIAELTCAVEYVHSLHFIHRDIKPDNILIDRNGHIKLTDFGLCTGLRWTHEKSRYVIYEEDNPNVISHLREDSFSLPPETKEQAKLQLLKHRQHQKRDASTSLVGTANYMAPEVIRKTGHTQNCDWWSIGVILYEMTFGRPPFMSQTENPHETQYKIENWHKYLDLQSPAYLPTPLSENCIDMIARLCCEEQHRIGSKHGAAEVKNHPWFKDIDFDNLRNTRAEFIPQVKHAEDTSNFDVGNLNCQDFLKDATLKSGHNVNPAFYDFTFRHFFDYEGGGQPTSRSQQRPSLAPLIEASSKQQQQQQQKSSTSTTASPLTNGNHHVEMPNSRQNGKSSTKQATIPVKTLASVAQQHQQQQQQYEQVAPRREPPLPQKPFTRILPSTNGKPFDRNAPVFVRRQQRVHLNGQLRRDLFPQSNNNPIHESENDESKL